VCYFHTHVWRTEGDFPENALESLKQKENIGITFSGGGTRSASATLGQLAALDKIGFLKRVKYISAVSGGGWTSIPYTFLPQAISDEKFFGPFEKDPSQFTVSKLNSVAHSSFAHSISETVIIDNFLKHTVLLAGDETFARAIGDVFLRKFGLHDLNRSFTFEQQTENSSLYQPKKDRPFLIVGATLLTEKFGKVPIELTPYYTGVRKHFQQGKSSFGGHYVSSYAYDSHPPTAPFPKDKDHMTLEKVAASTQENFFTLSDVAGSTGAAPQEIIHRLGCGSFGFPEFRHWGLSATRDSFNTSKETPHGDGGLLENLGVMPLFARQTERVIVFINTKQPLESISSAASSLRPLFGKVRSAEDEGEFATNVVLEGGHEKYEALIHALLQKKSAGEALIHTDRYQVLTNDHYGVKTPYIARITWVYNDRVPTLEAQLPDEVRRQIGWGSFERFPHYRTFFENFPRVIDLSQEQVSLLSHYSHWNVLLNQQEFQ